MLMTDVGDDITSITMSPTSLTIIFSNCSQNFSTSSFQTSKFQILDSSKFEVQTFNIFAEVLVPKFTRAELRSSAGAVSCCYMLASPGKTAIIL